MTTTLVPNAASLQFTSADLPFLNGWARLTWDGPSTLLASEEVTLVAAPPDPCLLICNRPSTEKLSSAQVTAVTPAQKFQLPVTVTRYRQTALALVNPSAAETASVTLSILDASGAPARLGAPDTFQITIGPLERVSKFLWQMAVEHSLLTVIIPEPEDFRGSVIITSDKPIALAAMNIMFPEGKFVTVPVFSPSP